MSIESYNGIESTTIVTEQSKIAYMHEKYANLRIEKNDGINYNIKYKGVKLDMNFKNLVAIDDAMQIIRKVERIYNNNYLHEDKRPPLYLSGNEVYVDNRYTPLFNFPQLDTTYLSEKTLRKFLKPDQSFDSGVAGHEIETKLVPFLNAILDTDSE